MSIFPKGIFDAEKQEAPELTKNTARKRRQERRQKAGPERRGPRLQIWPACPPLRKHRPGRGRRSRPEEGPPPFSWELRPLPPVPLPSRIRTPSALAVLPAGTPSPILSRRLRRSSRKARPACRRQTRGRPGRGSRRPLPRTEHRPQELPAPSPITQLSILSVRILSIYFFYTFQGSENHTSVRILSIHLIEHFQVRGPSSVRILSIQLFLHFQGRKKDRRQRPRGPHEFQYLYIVVLLAFKSLAASVTVPSGWAFFHSLTAASFVPDPGGRPFPRLQFSL